MTDIICRPYTAEHSAACLAIFDSNVPKFFAHAERAEFVDHLNTIAVEERPYLVLLRAGKIVGCGGLTIVDGDKRQASLSWGMIDAAFHRQGLGSLLVQERLVLARNISGLNAITLATSQHSGGFYERLGFSVKTITPDAFGLGLDRWDMILRF